MKVQDILGWKCRKLRVTLDNSDLIMWQSVSSFECVEGKEVQKEMEFSRKWKGSEIAALWNVQESQEEMNVRTIEQ